MNDDGRLSVDQQRLFTIDLENFQRLRVIGRGDVGTVYLVRDRRTGRLYAMKVMSKAEMIKRNKIHRVLTEREILATSAFPFILTLHGSFQDEHCLYLLIDWAPGGEFYRILQRMPEKRFSEQMARFYIAEVVLALEYLHTLGVVYRDLKPENILLQASGHLCLADFDLSKILHADPQIVRVSPKRRIKFSLKGGFRREHSFEVLSTGADTFEQTTNSFVGTAEYLAPEVIRGAGHGAAVDWWCVGVLLFEMLTGHAPFGNSRRMPRTALFSSICEAQLVWPDDVEVSREARSLVKKLLRPDPAERLGAKHGAADVKRHAFFRGVDWDHIADASPPLQPARIDPASIAPDPSIQKPWSESDRQTGRPSLPTTAAAATAKAPVSALTPSSSVNPFEAFGCAVSQPSGSATPGSLRPVASGSEIETGESTDVLTTETDLLPPPPPETPTSPVTVGIPGVTHADDDQSQENSVE